MKYLTIAFVFILFAASSFAQGIPPATLYVAPGGDDMGEGAMDAPLATPAGAKTEVFKLIAAGLTGDVLVFFREGEYFFDDELVFGAEDSGTADYHITYMAYPGESVTFHGGVEIDAAWFAPVEDQNILDRLPSETRDQVLVADLDAHGMDVYPALNRHGFTFYEGPFDDRNPPAGMELFFDGRPMQLGRWPNEGFSKVAGVPDGEEGMRFQYSGDRPERWTEATDVWFYGYWSAFWADCYFPAEDIDTATKTVTIRPISPAETEIWGWDEDKANGSYGIARKRPYYALNLLEEIDMPGEYYIDRDAGKLYFYPPADIASGRIFLSMTEKLMVLRDASHITFQNIAFAYARGDMVSVFGGEDVQFRQCAFYGGGSHALAVEGWSNVIEGNHFRDIGDSVIGVEGGDRDNLIPGENSVANNHIHDYARTSRMGTMAAWIEGVGNDVSHNLIHDAAHMAMRYWGNDHLISYNEIYNVCAQADDAGAIYTGRDYTTRGTLIKHNFIHDIQSSLNPVLYGDLLKEDVHGIYFDDAASATTAEGNILYNIQGVDIMIGGGRDNLALHNILGQGRAAFFIDRRMMDMTMQDSYRERLIGKMEDKNYTEPPWSDHYPLLAAMFDGDTPFEPENNRLWGNLAHDHNFWLQCGHWGSSISEWLLGVPCSFPDQQDNIERCPDPRYIDEAGRYMQLTPDSPAYTIPGFETIPFGEIGLAPQAPILYIADAQVSDEGGVIEAAGHCEPWARIVTARFGGRDVKSFLSVAENGAISGTFSLDEFYESPTRLAVVVAGPKGPRSETGYSEEIEVPVNVSDDEDDDADGGSDDDDPSTSSGQAEDDGACGC